MSMGADNAGLRVAVIGMGQRSAIARHVAEATADDPSLQARVVAVADVTAAGRDRGHDEYPDALVVEHHRDLTGHVDAAIVTTPDWTHAEIAIDLLRAGIAVYLEKPLAITVEDADAVLNTAAETGTPLYVGHNFRHAAVVRLMREIVDRGEIGQVKAVWCRHFVGNGGDYYFKDWHADRSKVNSLLLQKASHDLDVIHALGGGDTARVVGMGSLSVYGDVTDRRDRSGELMGDWFSHDNWPPLAQTGLNPVVDVEDVSMVMMTLDNGVQASYEQCHFTPDYWRNYTVIGTEGRLENIGDTGGGVVKVWTHRRGWDTAGDREYPIDGVQDGHADADLLTMTEFLRSVAFGEPSELSPIAARAAVAAGALATRSLRNGSVPIDVPPLPAETIAHFTSNAPHSTPSTPHPAQTVGS
ncbi:MULTISPECIES: Gfo/Idh/MocA family protein [Curtobacterium]|jgi:predicted dehydrogenase|uniref:Gfo/Idh/MocA family protein n=1 Tax=Curtobacterium TaxID=2034 RepID=UPI000DA9CB13|nr:MULTISPECIES: Gfo/Idh/MocA family oxidoreductase [Curtobacterium]MCS0647166.1 Gfo/Idh/MocA family oxidoreductase [Curtobacterium flaccumfaciens pv. flaccumfaciens]MCS6524761.1 Gfo/Idh/MocA family oxidoreductase [Curtobacterium flaccumfaciens pv. flaccumfaciens]MCS6529906.1 Gfo/Idh/MocA family oxidoreductase [Curtobacterium flaccumfaciens pv. flaccumfaciens]MCS6567903.1 Gfo/Idh/MocA family oxidoreductase [Curtobacterium flaccumfaciens pv. flaccumfaciens]MCS6584005.1 Gfo/Idh/MocA family oxido